MKTLISILIGLLVVGCGKKQSNHTNEGNNAPVKPAKKKVGETTPSKSDDNNSTEIKPVKEPTLEEKVVGTYEVKIEEDTITFVLLENGKHEAYVNGESWKKAEVKVTWKMVGKEVHIGEKYSQDVYKIEPNGDLTHIADIVDGMRTDQKNQSTIKKIK